MQVYNDGSLCNVKQTPQSDTGFSEGYYDKQVGLLKLDQDLLSILPQNHDKDWTLGYYDSGMDTTFCPL